MSDAKPISQALFTGRKVAFYTSFAGGKDLVELGGFGEAPRMVMVLDAAAATTLEFVEPSGATVSAAADKLIKVPIAAGVSTLTANTTASLVMVIW